MRWRSSPRAVSVSDNAVIVMPEGTPFTKADGTLEPFGVNAVCTHLGCVVPWNKAENKVGPGAAQRSAMHHSAIFPTLSPALSPLVSAPL